MGGRNKGEEKGIRDIGKDRGKPIRDIGENMEKGERERREGKGKKLEILEEDK